MGRQTRNSSRLLRRVVLHWLESTHKMRAARSIQRAFRHFAEIDPLTLHRIGKKKVSIVRYGRTWNYDAPNLRNYIHASGDFDDPIIRQTYSVPELMRIDRIGTSDTQRKDLLHNRAAIENSRRLRDEVESLWMALENEFVTLIMSTTDANTPDEQQEVTLPMLVQCFDNMTVLDRTRAYRVLSDLSMPRDETPIRIRRVNNILRLLQVR